MRRSSPRARTTTFPARSGRSRSARGPLRSAGTVRADRSRPLVLEVARLGLEVHAADPALRLVAEPAHLPFLSDTQVEDCASVTLGPASRRPQRRAAGKTLFETGSVWRLEEVGEQRLLTFRSPVFGRDPYLSVEFDREYTRGHGEALVGGPILAAGELHPFVYPFDELVFLARPSTGPASPLD